MATRSGTVARRESRISRVTSCPWELPAGQEGQGLTACLHLDVPGLTSWAKGTEDKEKAEGGIPGPGAGL